MAVLSKADLVINGCMFIVLFAYVDKILEAETNIETLNPDKVGYFACCRAANLEQLTQKLKKENIDHFEKRNMRDIFFSLTILSVHQHDALLLFHNSRVHLRPSSGASSV